MKLFLRFFTVYSISGLVKSLQILSYTKYWFYTHELILSIRGFRFIRNLCNAARHNPVFLVITAVNSVCKCIVYTITFPPHLRLYNTLCLIWIFWFPPGFWWKGFILTFYMVNSMSGLGKESESFFPVQYSMYIRILILSTKGCKLLRNSYVMWHSIS